jgi:BASS family bile acid:Na+ symporter
VDDIRRIIRDSASTVVLLTVLKMLALPITVYVLFKFFWPEYALSALLLSGVSTGVVAPVISNLVQANSPLVLVMVVITSPLVPFTLPALVKLLPGQTMAISLTGMIRMLAMVIFIPIAAVEILRRLSPTLVQAVLERRYPISLALFAVINMGVFSQYSQFFHRNPAALIQATLASLTLGGICLAAGIFSSWRAPVENQLAGGIIFANINNVLVIVFSSRFFGPLEPTVAAIYMVPFFLVIIPMRAYRGWKTRRFAA